MNAELQAIVVDDEALGRERLRILLEEFPNVSVCAECDGGADAIAAIREHEPDLVFLDIHMPEVDGFGVLAGLEDLGVPFPFIIFVTAYSEHAVRAFEVNAIDYLLKPVQADRLAAAVRRAEELRARPTLDEWRTRCGELLSSLQTGVPLQRIEIRSVGHTDYVNVEDVIRLQADGNYIELHTAAGTHLARMTLAELERQLDPLVFLRISRSAMVNLKCVASIRTDGRRGHVAVLHDGQTVPVTRGLEELQNRLKFAP